MNLIKNVATRGLISMEATTLFYGNKAKETLSKKLNEQDGSLSSEMAALIVGAIVVVGIGLVIARSVMKDKIAPGVESKIAEFFAFS